MLARVALFFAMFSGVSAIMLTPENWDTETSGKTVFIKFFAPWCGHCKKLKPAWDKLMDEFKGDPNRLVADVDCTAEGKPICDANGVKGFPSLKFGDPSSLEDYKGKRELADLTEHVKTKLVPSCSPANIDLCDDAKKAQIVKYQAMPAAELQALVDAKSELLADAEAKFKEGVKSLQKKYEELQDEKEAVTEEIAESGLGLMKAVAQHAAKVAAAAAIPSPKSDEL
jgi:protein disulfide-isomerase-like protein